jgi:WD40 repeat protein
MGQILASGSSDGTIKFWRRNGQFIQTLHHAKDGERVFRGIFTSSVQRLISASHKDIKIWQHQPDNTFTFRQHIDDKDGISTLSLHADNQAIVTAISNTQKSVKLRT